MDSRSPSWAVRDTSAEELLDMIRNSRRDKRAESISGYAVPPSPASSSLAYRDALPTRNRLSSASPFLHERVLTSREREVLKLLAEGKTVRATATVLGLSRKTVDAHKFNLMRKLGIHNKAQLVMWAIQKKVVKVPVNF
jgi:DNA-binding NarL/FixJ family response regulator